MKAAKNGEEPLVRWYGRLYTALSGGFPSHHPSPDPAIRAVEAQD